MKKSFLTVAIIISPLFYNQAFGCSCTYQPNLTPEEIRTARLQAFDSAAAVFSGKVVELEENRVKFKVEKIWKGDSVDKITMVIQEKRENGKYVMTSGDYSYKLGEKYLVYAYGTPDELRTHICSRTALLKNVDHEMKGLDEIRLPEIRNTEEAAISAKSNNSSTLRLRKPYWVLSVKPLLTWDILKLGQRTLPTTFFSALGLRNPTSEYERDILKAIMADEAGNPVKRLLFISKPGALKRLTQPGAAAMASWAERKHGIKIEIRELAQRALLNKA